jgi:hypothetical protein
METLKNNTNCSTNIDDIKLSIKDSAHFQKMIQSEVNLSIDDANLLIDSMVMDESFLKSIFGELIYSELKNRNKLTLSKNLNIPLSLDDYKHDFCFDEKLKKEISILIHNSEEELRNHIIPKWLE